MVAGSGGGSGGESFFNGFPHPLFPAGSVFLADSRLNPGEPSPWPHPGRVSRSSHTAASPVQRAATQRHQRETSRGLVPGESDVAGRVDVVLPAFQHRTSSCLWLHEVQNLQSVLVQADCRAHFNKVARRVQGGCRAKACGLERNSAGKYRSPWMNTADDRGIEKCSNPCLFKQIVVRHAHFHFFCSFLLPTAGRTLLQSS